ncbi:tetratricopeptide repeat protein [Actinoplanes sp. NPDC051494]|uniref:tetratricopeptide repeat protein n=1 Tax=Actinoplanes sp. NPDC051494 TaxID=3363907 RepID=UPI0037A8B424
MSDPRTTPSIFTRGAVDLGALRPASRPAAPAAPAEQSFPGSAGQAASIIDVTEENFQTTVLELSMTTPVIIHFWAEWSEPCKQLAPILEKLAAEGGGSWALGKVDVDANPRLAQALRVQSIPMVLAIVGGQLVEGFPGVIPEPEIRRYVDAVLKAGGIEVAAPEDPRMDAADDALMSGDLDEAEAAYRKILAESPQDHVAESGLAQVELYRRVTGVDAASVMAKAAADPDDLVNQQLAADIEVLSGQAPEAYDRLVALVKRTAGDDRDEVRKHLLALFTVAGPDDPAVATARRALARALF